MINGIDVSHWNQAIDWTQIKAGGFGFCYMKATEGVNSLDQKYAAFAQGAKALGILGGAYHFFHPSLDGAAQAEFFLRVMSPLQELPPVLDLETTNMMRVDSIIRRCLDWLQIVEVATKKIPIIYSSPSFMEQLGNVSAFTRYPLWIAHYGVKAPRIPAPWTNWTFWQNSEKGKVSGVWGDCDLDVFNGTVDDLTLLGKG